MQPEYVKRLRNYQTQRATTLRIVIIPKGELAKKVSRSPVEST